MKRNNKKMMLLTFICFMVLVLAPSKYCLAEEVDPNTEIQTVGNADVTDEKMLDETRLIDPEMIKDPCDHGIITAEDLELTLDSITNDIPPVESALEKETPSDPGTISAKDFGVKMDGVTDDRAAIQSAIDYVNSIGGGKIVIPYSTSEIWLSNYIDLKSNVELDFRGNTIHMEGHLVCFYASSAISNVTIRNVNFVADKDNVGHRSGIYFFHPNSSITDILVENINVDGAEYGLKFETAGSTRITINNIRMTRVYMPFYMKNASVIRGNHWYADCPTLADGGTNLEHAMYMNGGLSDVRIDDITFKNGSGVIIDICDTGNTGDPNKDFYFTNVQLYDCVKGIMISDGNAANINFQGIYCKGLSKDYWLVVSCSPTTNINDVTFSDFTVENGASLFEGYGLGNNIPTNITLKNGIVKDRLASSAFRTYGISNLIIDNVTFLESENIAGADLFFRGSSNSSLDDSVTVRNCKFYYNSYRNEGTRVFDFTGTGTYYLNVTGCDFINNLTTKPCINENVGIGTCLFENNTYRGFSTLIDGYDTTTIPKNNLNLANSKRCLGTCGTAIPTAGTYQPGHIHENTIAASSAFWKCLSAGTAGKMGSVTGNISSGTNTLTLSTATGKAGNYITIAGAGANGENLSTRIISRSGNSVVIANNAVNTVNDAAVSYTNPTWQGCDN